MTDTIYAANSYSNQIVAYDTNTFAEKFRLDVGENISTSSSTQPFSTGTLVASHDGRFLAIETPSGIRLLNIAAAIPTPSPAPTPAFAYPRDMVFDHLGTHLYITTGTGFVWPYNLSTGTFGTPYNVRGDLGGADIAVDDSYLLIAQYLTGLTQGRFQKLDLKTGLVTNINYALARGETGAWNVAVGSNGLALGTGTFGGSGWVPVRQIDLNTNAISIRADASGSGFGAFSGYVRQETAIPRSADGARFYFLESNDSSGPRFTYSAVTNTFGSNNGAGNYLSQTNAAVSRNGALLITRIGNNAKVETAPNFGLAHTFATNAMDSGVAFDATRDLLYGVHTSTDEIIAYDTNTYAEKFRLSIGEHLPSSPSQFSPGLLVASQDGHYLALMTPTTIRLFPITVPTSTPVPLLSAASEKVHGSAGAFDINLPLTGPRGVECRSGGASGEYTMVLTFANNLAVVGGARCSGGTVSSIMVDSSDPSRCIVKLRGVNNASYITVTLTNVSDSIGNHSDTVLSPSMGVLIADTTGDGSTNSADIGQTKSQSGQAVTGSNFRQDINTDGSVNSGDISLAKSKSGTALPSSP